MGFAFSPWRSLKARITFGTSAIFLAGLWSLTLFSVEAQRSDMESHLGSRQFEIVSAMALRVESELERRRTAVEWLAVEIGPEISGGRAAVKRVLDRQVVDLSLFSGGISVVRRDGVALVELPVPPGQEGFSVLSLDSVVAAFEGRVVFAAPAAGSGLPWITVSAPVRDTRGEVIGVVTGVLNLDKAYFLNRVEQVAREDLTAYLLVDLSKRTVIMSTNPSWRGRGLPEPGVSPALDRFGQGFEGSQVYRDAKGVELLTSIKRVYAGNWHVAAFLPTDEAFAPIWQTELSMLGAALVLTLVAGVLSWWLLRREFAPLLNAVNLLVVRPGAGDSMTPLPIERHDEVGELIKAVNGLLESLAKRQSELKDSEDRFRSVVECSPETITVSRRGVLLYANPTAWRLMGARSAEEVVGKSVYNWIHPEDAAALDARSDLFAAVDNNLPLSEDRFIKPDGSTLYGELYRTLILFGGQKAVLAIMRDVTARKLAESQVRQLSLAVEQSPESIVITDDKGLVEYVNDAFVQSSGYGRGIILGRSMSLVHSGNTPPQTYADLWATLLDGRVWNGEFVNRRRDGSDYIERSIISPLRQADGRVTHYVAVQQDVTQARRTDEELAQHRHHLQELVEERTTELAAARQVAEQANRAKSHFLAAASHDLRQPLSALSLYAGVLKERAPPQSMDLVLHIQDCVDSLSELLTDLLDVSKLDAGVVTPRLSDFAVNDLLVPLLSIHCAKAQTKGLRLRWRRSDAFAYGDVMLLRRILGNLVDNAIKYTRQGGVLVACRRREGRQWVEVWDTGPGIPHDKTGVIFEEFTQLDESRTQGSGLGLAIVAKTAALLGLKVSLRSRLGRGSVFAIELPSGRVVTAEAGRAAVPARDGLTIAVVDDNTRVLRALVLALESLGHTVIAGTSADELLANLDGRKPDLVISDYRLLAHETGFDVIRRLRGHVGETGGKPLPAIVVTGDTDPALIRSMATQGIDVRYKPLQLDSLRAFVDASRADTGLL